MKLQSRLRNSVILCLVASALFCGCERDGTGTCFTSPSFLVTLLDIDSISVKVDSPELIYVRSFYDYDNIVSILDKNGNVTSNLAAYCAKYGDDHYNREVCINPAYVWEENIGYVSDIIGITVTSESGFDAGHPAGTSLNGLIRWSSMSIYPYIRRGYTEPFDADSYTPASVTEKAVIDGVYGEFEIVTPDLVTGQLSDLTAEDMKIMRCFIAGEPYDHIGCFGFTSKPDKEMLHNMTIAVEFEDGTLLEAPFTVDFTSWQPE